MSHPARVSLRAPPHLPFIQGFPGIPGGPNRRPPGVHGTVEVRVGAVPIKAKWVRVEIRKHETIPPGFKLAGGSEDRTTWEHVGDIETLWQPSTPGKEFDVLETADFKFFIPLAENIPPSVSMMKESGIRYELVAAVCYKQKGGMFKKELSSVIKTTEDLRITKHELNSAWPLYNQPDSFNASAANGQVNLTVQRPWSAFGPNDRILLTAVLRSNQPKPFRVKGFECTLLEVVTVNQVISSADKRKSKKGPAPITKSRTVATARYPIDETIGKGGEKSARIDIPMTNDKLLTTVRNGRSIEVGYEMEVKAVCESVPEVVVRGMRDIGHFPPLCPAPPAPHSSNPPSSRPGSPTNTQSRASPPTQSPPARTFTPNGTASRDLGQPDFPPGFSGHPLSRPPVQGFNPTPMNDRRKSSSTITTTTTTHDFGPSATYQQGGRAYSTMPGPSQRNSMPVPSPYQNGNLLRTPSYGSSVNTPPSPHVDAPYNQNGQYSGEQDDYNKSKRFSSMTAGTFGFKERDQLESLAEHDQSTSSAPSSGGARTPRPQGSVSGDSTRGPPSAWLPAEQEKQRLYNDARARAANTQYQTGASMQDIGMDAPPDYDTPSRHTSVPLVGPSSSASGSVPAVVLTAAEEKEQQRKRYEDAQARSGAGGSSSGPSGSGSAPPLSAQPTYLSAAEEKEVQKRRFEDAQARVGGSATPQTANDSATGGMPWTHLSAAEEKDLQRKRYEEAARRSGGNATDIGSVSSRAASPAPSSMMTGAPSPAPGEQPIPYDAVFPSARGSSRPAQQPSSPLASGRNTPNASRQTELSDREAMNRYVYAKDRRSPRMVSNPSSSSTAPASPPTQRPMSGSAAPPASGSSSMALSNDEAMKRYYDQQARGDRSVASPIAKGQEAPPPFASGSSRPLSSVPSTPAPTAMLDEKAQMKRYYEALDKVNNAQSGGPANASASGSRRDSEVASPNRYSGPPPPIDAPSASGPSKPAAYMSAEEEKEQMRKRYENATSAVSRTQAPHSPQPNGSSSSTYTSVPAVHPPAQTPKPYLSAAEEKEQMRKRFEDATAAVNRKSTQPPLMSPQAYNSPPPTSAGPSGSSSSKPPAPYLSAPEEKDQMRKRYEDATNAVGRSSTQPPSAGSAQPPPPPLSPPGPSGSSSSRSPAPYLSAAEEKEQMRRRFEDATAAVNRKSTQPEMPRRDSVIPPPSFDGPNASSSSSAAGPATTSKSPPAAYMSAEQEKEQMRRRFENAQAAVNRSSMSPPPRSMTSPAPAPAPASTRQATTAPMPGTSAMGRRTSIPPPDPNAPPPPLPARPPAEYINLLSPVDEGERPPWSSSFGMAAAQASSSGSGARQ